MLKHVKYTFKNHVNTTHASVTRVSYWYSGTCIETYNTSTLNSQTMFPNEQKTSQIVARIVKDQNH